MRYIALILCCASLSGCLSVFDGQTSSNPVDNSDVVLVPLSSGPGGLRGLQNPNDPNAALVAGQEGRVMGLTIINLGDASVPGLWLETPLVDEQRPGSIIGENGLRVYLPLFPSDRDDEDGSLLSVAGYQTLGLDLSATSTVTVVGYED
jgi:hypothetical protein